MKRFFLRLALVVSALMVVTPAPAARAETFHTSFTGQSAHAYWPSADASGCVVTNVVVFGGDGRFKQTGHPVVESTAAVLIDRFDNCAEMPLIEAFGATTVRPDAFQINRKLTTATLNATVNVDDEVSGTSFPVDVNVSWTGVGEISKLKSHTHVKSPGFKLNARSSFSFREATASGTVSVAGTNLTPGATEFAAMESLKQGEVAIVH